MKGISVPSRSSQSGGESQAEQMILCSVRCLEGWVAGSPRGMMDDFPKVGLC